MDVPHVLAGRYEIGRLLGRGGMAVVHLARDSRLDRQVAVKLLRLDLADDMTAQTRFRREAQSAAALNHPSIVAVFDTGEDVVPGVGGQAGHTIPFIVMEYVQGVTLREMLHDRSRQDQNATIALPPSGRGHATGIDRDQGTPLPVEQAVGITAHVLAALGYSHAMGIVHRDIKPGNVMLTPDGTVKVMDFGIARALADTSATVTQAQTVVGTAQYLSPEQAKGEQVDARSDLYSTGCLLFELLTGRPPFTGDSPVAVAYQHVREQPQPPSAYNPAVGDELDRVVLHALAKNPADRYQSAGAFRDDLLNALDGRPVDAPPTTILAAPVPVPTPAPEPLPPARTITVDELDADEPRKGRGWTWVWVVLALIAVAGLGWFLANRFLGGSPAQTTVSVPAVTEYTQAQARDMIEAANLKYQEGPAQPSDSVPSGSVISQNPAANTSVAAGSTVTVVISSGTESVAVPDVSGKTQQDARTALESAGLSVGNVDTVDSTDVEKGLVVTTDPKAGAQLARGSEVNLQISSGQVTLPDLAGKSYTEARDTLISLGLKARVEHRTTSEAAPETVISTNPAGGSVQQGSTVTLLIARAPVATPTPTQTPTATGPAPTGTPTQPTATEPAPGDGTGD